MNLSYLPQMTDMQLNRIAKACRMGKGMGLDVTRDEQGDGENREERHVR